MLAYLIRPRLRSSLGLLNPAGAWVELTEPSNEADDNRSVVEVGEVQG